MKGNSAFPKASALLETHHHIFVLYPEHSLVGWGVLPLYREEVRIFYSPSWLGKHVTEFSSLCEECIYLPTPPALNRMPLKVTFFRWSKPCLNSVFLLLDWLPFPVEELILHHNSLIVGGRITGFILSRRVLTRWDIQITSSKIWTLFAGSISYDFNSHSTSTHLHVKDVKLMEQATNHWKYYLRKTENF